MTAPGEPTDEFVAGGESTHSLDTDSPFAYILTVAGRRLRGRVSWILPFALAGLVFTALDQLRVGDPIPAVPREVGDITIEFPVHPTVTAGSTRSMDAVVGFEPPYLAWALGLEFLSIVTVAAALWLTLSWAMGVEYRFDRFGSVLGFVVAVEATARFVGWIDSLSGLLGFGTLILGLVVAVRVFAAPALLVAGISIGQAIRLSWGLTRGWGWTLLGLILFFGLLSGTIAALPYVGTVATAIAVAPIHAMTVVVFCECATGQSDPDEWLRLAAQSDTVGG